MLPHKAPLEGIHLVKPDPSRMLKLPNNDSWRNPYIMSKSKHCAGIGGQSLEFRLKLRGDKNVCRKFVGGTLFVFSLRYVGSL